MDKTKPSCSEHRLYRKDKIKTYSIQSRKLCLLRNSENRYYFVITLITGEKIYVNLKRAFVYGLFSVSYVDNPDFVKLERFFSNGNLFINK